MFGEAALAVERFYPPMGAWRRAFKVAWLPAVRMLEHGARQFFARSCWQFHVLSGG